MKLSGQQLLEGVEPALLGTLRQLARTLRDAGHECYLVGGAVRDLLLGRSVGDFDIATDARPRRVQRLFRRTVPTGIRHGTITVLLNDRSFEVTTFRGESSYSDARRPDEVRFSDSLSEDLERRDFTVNAFALDPLAGKLVDEHNGLSDLEARLLRTIGRPRDRFFEDGLRPVRACRFAATLEFALSTEVLAAIAEPEVLERAARVAPERFGDELRKGFLAAAVSRMVAPLEESGLRDLFFKSARSLGSSQLARLDELFPAAVELRWAYWWQAAGGDSTKIARSLRLSKKEERRVALYQWLLEKLASGAQPDQPQLRRWLSHIKETLASDAEAFLEGVPAAAFPKFDWIWMLDTLRSAPLVASDLAVRGSDLMERGFSGPAVGRMLRTLVERVVDAPELNTPESLLAMLDGMVKPGEEP